jgi:thiol-disulfide isomerase/thioredoxin
LSLLLVFLSAYPAYNTLAIHFSSLWLVPQVVLLDFWGTGCAPCMAKLPELKSLYEKYRRQGFEVIGIGMNSEKDDVLRVIREKAIPWPVAMAENGQTNGIARDCGVDAVPDYWLIDSKGIVREIMADSELEKKIVFLLAEAK